MLFKIEEDKLGDYMKKQIVVLGLGVFGKSLALALENLGAEVIAIDKDIKLVEEVVEDITYAVAADFTDISQLEEIGIGDCDIAVIATGTRLEETLIGIINLKELGIPQIIAKVTNERYIEVLEKVGADIIIQPEKNVGESLAKNLVTYQGSDIIDIDENYSVVEVPVKTEFVNKSIIELDFRRTYGVNIIGIRDGSKKLNINFLPTYKLQANDHLLFITRIDNEKDMVKIDKLQN